MTNNLQDLLYCLREKPIMADCDQAADLLEKLAALPDELNEIEWVTITGEAPCDCANRIDQIFTEVLDQRTEQNDENN
jgi:hypothetical protein